MASDLDVGKPGRPENMIGATAGGHSGADGAEEIRAGLAASEFEPFFQPIVGLADSRLKGFEALARWRHSGGGIAPPADFIGTAEENGLIRWIDSAILERAWRVFNEALASCVWRGPPVMLSVNLSAENLLDHTIVDRVRELLAGKHDKASRLQFEITETLKIENIDNAQKILEQIQKLGVSIALDDFGTGYSSLVYLHRFPIDCIKIDRSFSSEILTSARSRAIIRAIVNLAKSMKLRTVVEGVEEKGVGEELLTLGCQYGQGLYFGAPTPAANLGQLLENART